MAALTASIQSDLFSASSSRPTQPKINKQKLLLKKCATQNLDLSDELAKAHMEYDDLRYSSFEQATNGTDRYYVLEDFKRDDHDVPVVSFFSGCGGLDLGFEAAGFQHKVLVENNEIFCNTIRHNRPKWDVLGPPDHAGDVSDLAGLATTLRRKLGRRKTFNGVFVGGPPCQPFSIAANQRFNKTGKNFKRTGFSHATNGNLLFDYIHFITEFKPLAFLIENVTGLMDVDSGEQLANAVEILTDAGYRVEDPLILNAQDYHIPQQRKRLFLIGSRSRKPFQPPKPSTKLVSCWKALETSLAGVENHVTRKHKADSILRYMDLEIGQRDQLGRVDRLNPNKPSKTVIAGGTRGGGRSHLHPNVPRTLSVRECARLQTFPDDYVFTGAHARQYTQVGNAVPPVLAAQLAGSIFDSFFT